MAGRVVIIDLKVYIYFVLLTDINAKVIIFKGFYLAYKTLLIRN